MDGIIEIKVNGHSISKDNDCAGVQGEGNSTKLRINFAENWDGFCKKITFWNALGQNPVSIQLGQTCLEGKSAGEKAYVVPIPPEAMTESGHNIFVIEGFIDGVVKRTVEDKLKVKACRTADRAGDPMSPTLSEVDQLRLELDATLKAEAEARNEALKLKADAQTERGGFVAGQNAVAERSGVAIGGNAKSTGPGAAIGVNAESRFGGAVGGTAKTNDGGAVGRGSVSGDGFAGGSLAKAVDSDGNGIDAIQLGTGTNNKEKTLQVYGYRVTDYEEGEGSFLADVGKLAALRTREKTDIVGAINELVSGIGDVDSALDEIRALQDSYIGGES